MTEIDPNIELHIEKTRKEDKQEYRTIFAEKWVEKVITWALYLVGGMILSAIVLSAVQFIK